MTAAIYVAAAILAVLYADAALDAARLAANTKLEEAAIWR